MKWSWRALAVVVLVALALSMLVLFLVRVRAGEASSMDGSGFAALMLLWGAMLLSAMGRGDRRAGDRD